MREKGEIMDLPELRAKIEENHADCYAWALRCCDNRIEEAEDVLQSTYLKILDGRACFGEQSSFKTWIFSVIRNTALDEHRRRWLRRLGLLRYENNGKEDCRHPQPAESLDRSQRQVLFRKVLAKLPRRQREVLHLVFYQELTLQEAAVVMGVSVGSARTHYDRGKQRLRQDLEKLEVFHEYR
jgi:RNA polymerase sigma-70 factor (ECF subfamily)